MFEITRLKMIDIIHQCMDEQIRPGDTVCDCTMGNGHDTAYMCRLTGDTGTVYSFDIQPEALSRTEALLTEEHLLTPARLIPRICAVLPEIQALFTASTFSRKHFHEQRRF
jgi:hypothetical protein